MKKLKRIISELHPDMEITHTTRLIDDRVLDSLDIVTLVTDINDAYGINIGAEDIIKENFETLDTIIALIERRGGKVL